MQFSELNYPVILITGLAVFSLGGLWYSPKAFLKPWIADMKIGQEEIDQCKTKGMRVTMVLTFLMCMMEVFVLAIALKAMNCTSPACGAGTGLMLGVGFAAMPIAINHLFERHSLRFFLITAGYPVASLTIAGAVLAAWPK